MLCSGTTLYSTPSRCCIHCQATHCKYQLSQTFQTFFFKIQFFFLHNISQSCNRRGKKRSTVVFSVHQTWNLEVLLHNEMKTPSLYYTAALFTAVSYQLLVRRIWRKEGSREGDEAWRYCRWNHICSFWWKWCRFVLPVVECLHQRCSGYIQYVVYSTGVKPLRPNIGFLFPIVLSLIWHVWRSFKCLYTSVILR